jgi:hypothetical protein
MRYLAASRAIVYKYAQLRSYVLRSVDSSCARSTQQGKPMFRRKLPQGTTIKVKTYAWSRTRKPTSAASAML